MMKNRVHIYENSLKKAVVLGITLLFVGGGQFGKTDFVYAAEAVSAQLEDLPGKAPFQQKCTACHTIGEGDRVGPDLRGVDSKRESAWLTRWITHPDEMIAEKDPIAIELLNQFSQVPMPNLGVAEDEAKAIIAYIGQVSSTLAAKGAVSGESSTAGFVIDSWYGTVQFYAFVIFLFLSLAVVIVYWRVALSTKNSVPTVDKVVAYAIRKKFFIVTLLAIIAVLAATMPFTPYAKDLRTPDHIVYVAAKQFGFAYSSEPINSDEDMAKVATISNLEIGKGELVEFRVTSLDATHDFGIYDPDFNVLAQTQAMPGYTNRLRVQFEKLGKYDVLCLEYCGIGHHKMKTDFKVVERN